MIFQEEKSSQDSTTGLKIIYEDDNLLVIDKPAGISVLREGPLKPQEETIAELLVGQYPELEKLGEKYRYGITHRLDKDTSGILLVAKTKDTFEFLQKQFQTRQVEKKYTCLVVGNVRTDEDTIETLLGRSLSDRRKQKVYLPGEPNAEGKRMASTKYRVLQRYQGYTFLEVTPKTGRKHQIRTHLASIGHPIARDKLYGFKNQPTPAGLSRHFLHASYLKTKMLDGTVKEFVSELPEDLKRVSKNLETVSSI